MVLRAVIVYSQTGTSYLRCQNHATGPHRRSQSHNTRTGRDYARGCLPRSLGRLGLHRDEEMMRICGWWGNS